MSHARARPSTKDGTASGSLSRALGYYEGSITSRG
jgi:hypothetical protein